MENKKLKAKLKKKKTFNCFWRKSLAISKLEWLKCGRKVNKWNN